LHSPDYRERFGNTLSKELPRILRVKSAQDFWKFSRAGRKLADLHTNYETVEKYPLEIVSKWDNLENLEGRDFTVTKMQYAESDGKNLDKTTLIYNDKITIRGIPIETHDYVVNGKSALDWVVERQCQSTDNNSRISNNANDWATETMHNPRYPLELIHRITTVSLQTLEIIKTFPPLDM
jgi:predicted helicase